MLSHQLKRMPTAPVVITNHAAQFFPTLQHQGRRILFDKILCDVPCTGDGAARKLPTRWLNWSARDGNAIHPLQLSILMRALNLCKVGGLVLYSTCSLNPIEDEAVVTEIFRRV
jgi:16S rRNA C967 or C1407 C5-methylase (RsmB/RsmF family)